MSPGDADVATGNRSRDRLSAIPVPRAPRNPGGPSPRGDDQDRTALPPAGQPGHSWTASLRRQPARIVQGRVEGGYSGAFELICCECGDHPYLDYSQISPRLQRIRGPYTMKAGLAAYENHLGLTT